MEDKMLDSKVDDERLLLELQERRRTRRRRALRHVAFIGLIVYLLAVFHVAKPFCRGRFPHQVSNLSDKEMAPTYQMDTSEGCTGPRRSLKRHETFRAITGSFNLYDELDLSTTAGSINIVVYPQPGCGPSILHVRSFAGSIDVTFATSPIADDHVDQASQSRDNQSSLSPDKHRGRPLVAQISTTAGSINTELLAASGSSVMLSSLSGTINSKIFVGGAAGNDSITRLGTSTAAGSQYINVLVSPNCSGSCSTIDKIDALHTISGSAQMTLNYPRQWQGNLHAKVDGAGTVDASGEDLEFVLKTDTEVVAWRGENGDEAGTIEAVTKGSAGITFNADGRGF